MSNGSGSDIRLRIAIVTNVLPHYRAEFYRRLFQREDLSVRVFCQAANPGTNLALVHDRFADHVTIVPSACLNGERLGWQWLPWRRLLTAYDVLFVYGNPRIVSNVALASLARALGRPIVLWGQAHTAGAGALTERLRLWWWRGFANLFVYTDGEVGWLRSRGFTRQHIVGMNNGLDQRRIDEVAAAWDERRLAGWRERQGIADRTVVLSCARLEPKNSFDLWLEAMPAVMSRYPDLLWCAIGDGRERQALQARARELGMGEHVRWLGSVFDEPELAPWFLSSRLLVHPSGIGLTLLHAFGYGLPVVTQDDASAQMPEFDAFVPGETGLLYQSGNISDLVDAVCRCLSDDAARRRMARRAQQIARERYNIDQMTERFVGMAKSVGARP